MSSERRGKARVHLVWLELELWVDITLDRTSKGLSTWNLFTPGRSTLCLRVWRLTKVFEVHERKGGDTFI